MIEKLGVSIILCCHNSAKRLPETLSHLQKQIVSPEILWEVILVNNASTDDTSEVAKQIWISEIPFKVVDEPNPGLIHARIKGFQEAQYEFVSFVDDDNWVDENWVKVVYQKMIEHPEVGALGGQSLPAFESKKPSWFDQFESSFAVGKQLEIEGEMPYGKLLWGAGITIRKTAWVKLKENGYKPLLHGRRGKHIFSGEDSELCYSLLLDDWKLFYTPSLIFYHFMPDSRINWIYLSKLFRGFGRKNIYLQIYQKILDEKNNLELIKDKKRLPKIIILIFSLIKNFKLTLKAFFYSGEGDFNVIKQHSKIGMLVELVRLRGELHRIELNLRTKFL
jgi:glycosyltransferase involved in cell wall biosynthesis